MTNQWTMRGTAGAVVRWLALPTAALTVGCITGTERAVQDEAPPAVTAARPEVREGYALTPDGVKLWYRVVGTGRETVILNAANYHRDSFDALVTPARRVVLYDIRGRGKTDSVPPAKTGIVEFDAADIEVIREAVGADSVALIGWSGGALSVFRYALLYPTRVTRIILLAPVGPRWVPWWDDMRASAGKRADTAAANRLAKRVRAGEFAQSEGALCREQARIGNPSTFGDTTLAHLAPDVCDSPNEWPARYGAFVGRLLGKLGKYDWRGDLAKVRAPRLVIHGERDNPPLGGSQEWVAGLPAARLLVMNGVGHWPQLERPKEALEAIRAFLDGQWPLGSELVPGKP